MILQKSPGLCIFLKIKNLMFFSGIIDIGVIVVVVVVVTVRVPFRFGRERRTWKKKKRRICRNGVPDEPENQ